MTRFSDLHGRLLEYLIVEALMKLDPQIQLSEKAKGDQLRDSSKGDQVKSDLLNNLSHAAETIVNDWLYPKFLLLDVSDKEIDRLPDQNKSDVTDIRLMTETKIINLSIKHNHTALKHQRPRTTPQHCGFTEQSTESKYFKQQYQEITNYFISSIGNYKQFNQLPEGSIESQLYIPVCKLVRNFINTNSDNCADQLFRYFIGDRNYYKIIVNSGLKEIQIQEFNSLSISSPMNVLAEIEKQYVTLNFDNNWEIKMRLHTASSKIKVSPDLKFDTKLVNSNVSYEILTYD